VLDHALFERAQQSITLLPDGGTVDCAACSFELQDADLQRGQSQFLAVTPIGHFCKHGDCFWISDREVVQVNRLDYRARVSICIRRSYECHEHPLKKL